MDVRDNVQEILAEFRCSEIIGKRKVGQRRTDDECRETNHAAERGNDAQ